MSDADDETTWPTLTLPSWRRRVAELYAAVRDAGGGQAGWELWRTGRDAMFAEHPDAPVDQSRFTGLRYRPYDPDYRFVAQLERVDGVPERLEVQTGSEGLVTFRQLGSVDLDGLGSLAVWWLESYAGGLFVPIRDATCTGGSSYGGGRYVLDTAKGADLGQDEQGRVVVDLNYAYNPSCAYDVRWVCPLAPSGNILDAAVEAGELTPAETRGLSE